MAKESGLGANFYLDEVDLSGDTGSLNNISKSASPLVMTGIDKYAFERKAGQLDAQLSWQSYFNPSTGQAHPALANGTFRNDRIGSYFHRPTLGMPVASMVGKQTTYAPTRGNDGSLMVSVDMLANQWWLDWGLALTAGKRTDGSATNGTGVDFSAAGTFGLQAYLHVFAFTGTSVTIKLQQSSDNGSADAFADVTGGAFTLVTGVTKERIATARNQAVERYLRVVTTGTFSNVVFAVSAVVNRTDLTI